MPRSRPAGAQRRKVAIALGDRARIAQEARRILEIPGLAVAVVDAREEPSTFRCRCSPIHSNARQNSANSPGTGRRAARALSQ